MDTTLPDRAPPMKTAEEYAQEEFESAKNGIAMMLMLGFAATGSVQLLSRKIGSSGPILHAGRLIGLLMLATFYQARVDLDGSQDAIHVIWVLSLLGTIWLIASLMLVICPTKSYESEIQFGKSILSLGRNDNLSGAICDVVMASSLSGLFYLFSSPIQGGYFVGILYWLLICHGWLYARNLLHRGRYKAAGGRATDWRNKLTRRQS